MIYATLSFIQIQPNPPSSSRLHRCCPASIHHHLHPALPPSRLDPRRPPPTLSPRLLLLLYHISTSTPRRHRTTLLPRL